MDGEEGWRVGNSNDGCPYENSIINRIMLRFRPIAPKPVNHTDPSSSACAFQQGNKNLKVSSKRSKRKYVRVSKNNQNNKSTKKIARQEEEKQKELNKTFITLQLLPEKSCEENSKEKALEKNQEFSSSSMLIDCAKPRMSADLLSTDPTAEIKQIIMIVESCVVVECISDTCMDAARVLGCTDMERMNNLENDTCPGFVSDSLNNVVWINEAYKSFVSRENDDDNNKIEVGASLVVKERLSLMCLAFSCRVKLQYYTWGKEKKSSMSVPCDVWRMDFGGFAWRLDVRAALSL